MKNLSYDQGRKKAKTGMSGDNSLRTKLIGTFWVVIAYIAAIGAAAAAVILSGDLHPLILAGIGDIAATLMIFLFSFLFNNSSFYDPYWSVAPPLIGLYWLMGPGAEGGDPIRQYLVLGLVTFWALRLTWNWYRGWTGLRHEDWRYVAYRKKGKPIYWLVSFFGFHFFPTVLVYVGCAGMYVALTSEAPLAWLDFVAAAVIFGAVVIQGIADNQLRAFRLSKPPKEAILSTGIWAWSRHPNYFGEISLWVGVFLFSLAADPSQWWTIAGPLGMIFLFSVVSIPLIDKRMLERRPGYAAHRKKVSALIPMPPKKGE